ncbi:MAG: TlpA family protein disulfide reductase [Rhodobacteraceae bacterium]|nr:TlpA family protein disulfide reductase [Paracoccaceae bacterium]
MPTDARFKRRKLTAALALLALAAPLSYGALIARATPTDDAQATLKTLARGEMAAVQVHDAPQEVAEHAFFNADDEEIDISAFQGQVLLVNFWATWCAPCLKEMPAIDSLAGAMADQGLKVVAINLDRSGPDKGKAFYQKISAQHLDYFHEPSMKVARAMATRGLPTSILIDRQGREVARLAGPAEWDSDDAKALIAAIADGDAS